MRESMVLLALDSETTNFKSLIRSGTQLLRAYRSDEDLAGLLTCYALGAEKLTKLSIGLGTQSEGKPWPSKADMRQMGHDVVSLDKKARVILKSNIHRAPSPNHVHDQEQKVTENPVIQQLLAVLGDYGSFGRFHDLDQLAGSPQSTTSPRYQWQDITRLVPIPDETYENFNGINPWVEAIKIAIENAMLDWCHLYTNSWAQGIFGETAKRHAKDVSVSQLQLGSGDDN